MPESGPRQATVPAFGRVGSKDKAIYIIDIYQARRKWNSEAFLVGTVPGCSAPKDFRFKGDEFASAGMAMR